MNKNADILNAMIVCVGFIMLGDYKIRYNKYVKMYQKNTQVVDESQIDNLFINSHTHTHTSTHIHTHTQTHTHTIYIYNMLKVLEHRHMDLYHTLSLQ